ncbi:MAG: pectate lyase, partial [Bacteroidetes bacterium]|nr:pectate lyase [Bacteroidota bacterium]
NGFKLGGDYTAHNATLRNCISVKNKVKGFDQNNDNGTMILYNCTGYLNQRNYGFTNSSYGKLVIKNSASLSSTTSNSFTCKEVNQEYNTWNAGFSCNSADFVSLDYTQLLSPRKADGSLPEISLLHLVSTSSMIDKGTNLGLAYSGLAPDLGAFEFNAQTAVISPCKTEKLKVYFSNANKEIIVSGFVSKVEIFDISAKKIFEIFENSENLSIPASDWAKGTYLIRVFQANTDLSVYKIILP